MKFKKILALMLTLLLAFSVCLAFIGCSDTPTECTKHADENGDGVCDNEGCGEAVEVTPGGDGEEEYFNENGELILYKNGVPTFNFVYGQDAKSTIASLLDGLAKELNTINGIEEGGVGSYPEDSKQYTPQAVEIIAGTITTRGDEYKLNKYELGYNGYIVKQIGTKILLLGGSNDALTNAFNYLKTTVFGITKTTKPFVDLVMSADKNCDKTVTKYKLTDVKIGENSIKDYTLISPLGDSAAKKIVGNVQDTLYKTAGIRLESKSGTDVSETGKSILVRTVANDGVSDGFEIRIEGDDLIIECMYPLLFEDTFNAVYEPLLKKTGVATLNETSTHLRTIYYEDYADKTGKVNALAGIIECHNYANANGHSVKALRNGTGTFYIGESDGKFAIIKTDTDWTGATFTIDDSFITAEDKSEYTMHIFYVWSDYSSSSYRPNSEATSGIEKFLYDINLAGGIDKDTFNKELKFDLGLGRDALVYIYNENHNNYVRYGVNEDEGTEQQEFIYLKADGTVDKSTPLLYSYSEVTKIVVRYINDTPITITGGTINTIANSLPRNYTYYTHRGISITRSNTTIDGLTHTIEGEGETGAPYSGFITIEDTNNVTIKNTVLTGHRAYELEGSNGTNTMGTYDLSPARCNNTLILNVTQTNFFIKDTYGYDVPSVSNGYWGIMGGNDCKNLTYDGCRLTRYDSHRGTVNSTIIRSEVSNITVIGGGTLRIEDSKIYMSTSTMNYLRKPS